MGRKRPDEMIKTIKNWKIQSEAGAGGRENSTRIIPKGRCRRRSSSSSSLARTDAGTCVRMVPDSIE